MRREPPDPIDAYSADIALGVAPLELASFNASLVQGGSARVEGNFTPFTARAGDLMLMRPGTICTSISLSPVQIAVVQVDTTFLVDQLRWARPSQARTRRETYRELLGRARQPVQLHLDERSYLAISELFVQLTFLSKQSGALGRTISRATELIWTIETLLVESQRRPVSERVLADLAAPSTRDDVALVLHTIHERYASNLSISELAREVSLSESALRRAVRASTGFTLREYLHRVRLLRFEHLVAESTVPFAEAARMVGWSSASHARAAFFRSHGMSPRAFRAEAQESRRAEWWRTSGARLDWTPTSDQPPR